MQRPTSGARPHTLTQTWHVGEMKHSIKELYLKTGDRRRAEEPLLGINRFKAFMNSWNKQVKCLCL